MSIVKHLNAFIRCNNKKGMSETEDSIYSDDTSDNISEGTDNQDTNNQDTNNQENNQKTNNKQEKKKPIKTEKMVLSEAVKTVDERSLFAQVDRFFRTCPEEKINKMVKIINNEDAISLRMLNWFAMKHSATMESLDVVGPKGNIELFDVKISYRARLNTHSKKYFDPFRRGKRFDYNYDPKDPTKTVETTLCQLNFFRWLIMHNLLDYVANHFNDLKQKMGLHNNVEKKKKETKKEKEKMKKTIIKNKKEELKISVKRFIDDNTSKLVIVM